MTLSCRLMTNANRSCRSNQQTSVHATAIGRARLPLDVAVTTRLARINTTTVAVLHEATVPLATTIEGARRRRATTTSRATSTVGHRRGLWRRLRTSMELPAAGMARATTTHARHLLVGRMKATATRMGTEDRTTGRPPHDGLAVQLGRGTREATTEGRTGEYPFSCNDTLSLPLC